VAELKLMIHIGWGDCFESTVSEQIM